MVPEERSYADLDQIDPSDRMMVEFWAKRWGVSSDTIFKAIAKVGPLRRNVTVEVWNGL